EISIMASIRSGLIGGFVATLVIAAMMQMKTATHSLPELHMVTSLSNILGSPGHIAMGWLAHFVLGTFVWGIAYAVLARYLPGRTYALKGLVFGLILWVAMMLIFMPLTGGGFFAIHRGITVIVATLVLQLVYGVVLGIVYGWEAPAITPVKVRTHASPRG
ncbi:MAG TPA: DUF6789 family protein, partial [Burkholderiales bacterium]|nr:DUF6789 family protein [Burkholderiales bacterium]